MAEQLANNAATTLDGAISNVDTSVVVTDGSVFPSSGNFRLLIQNEIILCTARSSNTLTVTRAQEGTTGTSHADGLPIELIYTKGSFNQILSDYWQRGGYASRPSSPRSGTMYTATDLLNAKWLYNGSSWDLISPVIIPNAKKVDFSGWTAMNQGTSTFVDKNGILHVTMQISNDFRGFYKTKPTSPFKMTVVIYPHKFGDIFIATGIGVRENSSGKMRLMYYMSGQPGSFRYDYWNSASSYNSTILSAIPTSTSMPIWLRYEDDNTNWVISASRDGKAFGIIYQETRNTVFTADQIVVGCFNNITLTGNPLLEQYILSEWEE